MAKRKTHRLHGYGTVTIRLTGDVSAEFPVVIPYGDDVVFSVTGDAVGSAVLRVPHHASFPTDTEVQVASSAEAVLPEPETPSGSDRLLKWIVPPARLEAMRGDLEEGFRRRARLGDEHAARKWYTCQLRWTTWHECLRLLPRICGFAYLLQKLGLL